MASALSKDTVSDEHSHNHDHRHAPAQSFVLDAQSGTSRNALEVFFRGLPENVWRVKGFTQLDGKPALVQFTMGQLEIVDSEQRDNYHMVFIGPDMNQTAILNAFNSTMMSANE